MAIDFDAVNDVIVTTGGGPNLTTMTLMAWVNPEGYGEGSNGRIMDQNSVMFFILNSTNQSAALNWDRTGILPSPGQWRTPINSIVLNVWTHIAVTYDRSNNTNDPIFYINGLSVTVTEESTPSGTIATSSSDVTIGNRTAGDRTFDGSIEDLRIYSRILSAAEIQTIYTSEGTDSIVENLELRYVMAEGADGVATAGTQTIKDESTFGRHGTPSNGPIYRGGVTRNKDSL